MFVRVLEVGLFALIGLALLAPVLRRAVRRVWPAPVEAGGVGEGGRSAADTEEVRRRWAGRIGGSLFALAIINFLAFSLHTSYLGGSADSGKRAEGHFFVSSHGNYTEVTEEQWRVVRAHGIAKNVTHVLGLVVGGALLAYSQRLWGSKTAEPHYGLHNLNEKNDS